MSIQLLCACLLAFPQTNGGVATPTTKLDLGLEMRIHTAPRSPERGGWMSDGRIWLWDGRWLSIGSRETWQSQLLQDKPMGPTVFRRIDDTRFFHQRAYPFLGLMLVGNVPSLGTLDFESSAAIYRPDGTLLGRYGGSGFLVLDVNARGEQLGISVSDRWLEIRGGKTAKRLVAGEARAAFLSLTDEGCSFGALAYGRNFEEGRFKPAVYDGKKLIELPLPEGYSMGVVSAYRSPKLCAGVVFSDGTHPMSATAMYKVAGEPVIWRDGKPHLVQGGAADADVTLAPVAFFPDGSLVGASTRLLPSLLPTVWISRNGTVSQGIEAELGLDEAFHVVEILGWRDDGSVLLSGYRAERPQEVRVFELTPKHAPSKRR